MSGKKVNLAEVFKQNEQPGAPQLPTGEAVPAPLQRKENLPATRQGKRILSGWFDPEVHRQLRMIAASEDKTLERVIGDALNTFFADRGIPPIA